MNICPPCHARTQRDGIHTFQHVACQVCGQIGPCYQGCECPPASGRQNKALRPHERKA